MNKPLYFELRFKNFINYQVRIPSAFEETRDYKEMVLESCKEIDAKKPSSKLFDMYSKIIDDAKDIVLISEPDPEPEPEPRKENEDSGIERRFFLTDDEYCDLSRKEIYAHFAEYKEMIYLCYDIFDPGDSGLPELMDRFYPYEDPNPDEYDDEYLEKRDAWFESLEGKQKKEWTMTVMDDFYTDCRYHLDGLEDYLGDDKSDKACRQAMEKRDRFE